MSIQFDANISVGGRCPMTPGRVLDEAKDRGAFPAGEPGGGVEAPAGAARGAARAGAGARARMALQPGRSAAGDGVPGVAGVVRAALGGEPGAAEAAGGGGRQLSVCCGHFSHERGEAVEDRESLVFREGGKIEQAALYPDDPVVGNNLRLRRHPEGGHREAKQSNGTKTSVSELT